MKKTLKLIPAICMLMIAAVLVSTATYAWFSMNSAVTAVGMQIKATADGNLLIAKVDSASDASPVESKYGVETDLSTKADGTTAYGVSSIKPGSTVNLTDWYSATAASPSAYNKGATTSYGEATNGTNYITRFVYLKSISEAATVYLSEINVSGSGVAFGQESGNPVGHFYDSMRVGVLYADGNYVIYNLDHTGDHSGRAVAKTAIASTDPVEYEGAVSAVDADHYVQCTYTAGTWKFTPANGDNAKYCEDIAADTPELVKIFIWFEGEDDTCFTNNVELDDVTVAVKFTAK